jgi:hypothetical protein
MKYQILLMLSFILISCNKNKTTELLKLEILNKQVFCSLKEFKKNMNPTTNIKNFITFKLTNNSSKNYFLVLNENDIEFISNKNINSPSFQKKARICFEIDSSNNSNIESYTVIGHNNNQINKDCIQFIPEIYEMTKIKSELKDLEYPDIQDYEFSNTIRLNSFVLHAKETKYFRTILYLPTYKNNLKYDGFLSYFKFDNKENYNLKLKYLTDSKIITSKLPKYKMDEIEENKTEIFNGILVSNSIPIVFK